MGGGSKYCKELPEGCVYCERGSKMVLLVTGKCGKGCFYCPISEEKTGKDVVYADEWPVFDGMGDPLSKKTLDGIFTEGYLIDAEGTGITGGDPMIVPERTTAYIRKLKEAFGKGHHIHLYTAALFDAKWLAELEDAGLDEIRFHPSPEYWGNMKESRHDALIRAALKTGMDVGAEVPSLPDFAEQLLSLAEYLESVGAKFLNLNELEFASTNEKALHARGYAPKSDISAAVAGSGDAALRVIKQFYKKHRGASLAIHYCSAGFKDGIQLRRRLARRAKNVAKPYEMATGEGTLLKGVIKVAGAGCSAGMGLLRELAESYDVPTELMNLIEDRIEIAPWVLNEIAGDLAASGHTCYISECYPTWDGLEVERIPLA